MKKNPKARKSQKNKRISRKQAILLFLIILFLSIGVTSIFHFFYSIKDAQSISTRVEVNNKIGFALGNEGLDFGIVPRGGSVTREIILVNQEDTPVVAKIAVRGSISKFIGTSSSFFILQGSETKEVSFSVSIPENAKIGNYTGKIFIIFERN